MILSVSFKASVRKIQYSIAYFFIRCFLVFLRFLPKPLFPFFCALFYAPLKLLARRDLSLLRTNIDRVWHLPPKTTFSTMFENQVIKSQVKCTLEGLKILIDPSHIHVSGLEELKFLVSSMNRAAQGVLFVTAHIGLWELCAYYAAKVVQPSNLHVLAKPTPSPLLTHLMTDIRTKMGVHVLLNDSKTLIRDMVEVLKKGDSLGFVMDQKPDHRGVSVDFFRHQTEFVTGPARLAVKFGNPVVSIFCVREDVWRYRLIFRKLLSPNHNLHDEAEVTNLFAREIERVIKLYPDQWTWSYKRWTFSSPQETIDPNGI